MKNSTQPIFIGIGTTDDPLPEEPKTTKFWVFSDLCVNCDSSTRFLEPVGTTLILRCGKCGEKVQTFLPKVLYKDISYVFWCQSPIFKSDKVKLPAEASRKIEELLKDYDKQNNAITWAVVIKSGKCSKYDQCVSESCPYSKFGKTNKAKISPKPPKKKPSKKR